MKASALLALVLVAACASAGPNVKRDARRVGRAVSRGDAVGLSQDVHPAVRSRVDHSALLERDSREQWDKALKRPQQVREEAVVLLHPDVPVATVRTPAGWRFAEDPTDVYSQATPRQALRALTLASRHARWDVLLRLAPRRYRMGLSQEDLEAAWTTGEQAQALQKARDRLVEHLEGPVLVDGDEATLDLGEGKSARLEREGDRWVVAEF